MTGTTLNVIGTHATPFTGSFDGDGFVISNVSINVAGDYIGFIRELGTGGSVSDLGLEGVGVNAAAGATYVGGLVGENEGTVSESYTTGTVNGDSEVGGLVGDIYQVMF